MRNYFIFRHCVLMRADSISRLESPAHGYSVTVTQEMIPGLEEAFHIDRDEVERRFAEGDTCFLIRDAGNFLGIMWGHRGECFIRGLGKRLNLDDSSVYLYHVFTRPEARRRHVYTALKTAFFKYYGERGVCQYFSLVDSHNMVMRNSFRKDGFVDIARIIHVRFGTMGILYEVDNMERSHALSTVGRAPKGVYVI